MIGLNPRTFLSRLYSIFGIIGLVSARLVGGVVDNERVVAERGERLIEVQRAMQIMQRDLMQLSGRQIRDQLGDPVEAVRIGADGLIEFTRLGWRNPLEQRRAESPKSRVRLLLVCADHPKENLKLEITFPPLGDGEEEVRTPRSRETGGASSSGSGAGSSGGAPSDEGEEAAAEEHSPGSPSGPWLVFRSARGSWSI